MWMPHGGFYTVVSQDPRISYFVTSLCFYHSDSLQELVQAQEIGTSSDII